MKRYINIALMLLIASSTFAQVGETNDPAATKILDKLKERYDSFKTMEADFTLEMNLTGQDSEEQNGKIIQSGDKFFLKLDEQAIYNNGVDVWVHLIANKEVQLSEADYDEDSELMSPKDMLRVYESNEYLYAITEEKKELVDIEFKPLDRDSDYIKMRLTIDKNKNMMKKIAIFARDGSKYSVTLHSLTSNKEYDDKIFAFDKAAHPGVHVEDLRID